MSASSETRSRDAAFLAGLQDANTISDVTIHEACAALRERDVGEVAARDALAVLGAAVYQRPEVIGEDVGHVVWAYRQRSDLSPIASADAENVASFLLASPAARKVVDVALSTPPATSIEALRAALRILLQAAEWLPQAISPERALSFAARVRDETGALLFVERVLLSQPDTVTTTHVEMVERLWPKGESRYCLAWLAGHAGVTEKVRSRALAAVEVLFPLQRTIPCLPTAAGVLMVQNIADEQGDEMLRAVPLMQGMLDAHSSLHITLITTRSYLYAHPRVRTIPLADRVAVRSALRAKYSVVVNYFDAGVPEVNYDPFLEDALRKHIATYTPVLLINASKAFNHLLFDRVTVEGVAQEGLLELNRQRVDNVYEPHMRLLVELGGVCRLGESKSRAPSVLAGMPCPDSAESWRTWTKGNDEERPVALLNGLGGEGRLKGYTDALSLAERMRQLVMQGYFVVALPNRMPWGGTALLHAAAAQLNPGERKHVTVALVPPEEEGQGRALLGGQPISSHSYWMRCLIDLMPRADLVVTVEGWMGHAAYMLGLPYRTLMMPYSKAAVWHPYGRTIHQGTAALYPPVGLTLTESVPLPEQPRKQVLEWIVSVLGRMPSDEAALLLVHIAASEDRHLRRTAMTALGEQPGKLELLVDRRLIEALDDGNYKVRGAAARALLRRGTSGVSPLHLTAHTRVAERERSWQSVVEAGTAGLEVIQVCAEDDDDVIRREARAVLALLRGQRTAAPPLCNLRITPSQEHPRVLVLTPVKDAASLLDAYWDRLRALTYPRSALSLGFLESDSQDDTYARLLKTSHALSAEFRRIGVWKRDFGFRVPAGVHRWTPAIQPRRRAILARSRNHLLFHALDDEDWVLWLDVDVNDFPLDVIERLLDTGKDIVYPHCVVQPMGQTFDYNAWVDAGRRHLGDLRGQGRMVPLDAVGGTMLLVRADAHRDGVIFPAAPYGAGSGHASRPEGEMETEGLGLLARDMGYQCWGLLDLEVVHRRG